MLEGHFAHPSDVAEAQEQKKKKYGKPLVRAVKN